MFNLPLGVFVPDVSLFDDAELAIIAIVGALVAGYGVALAGPVARKVYRSVAGLISRS